MRKQLILGYTPFKLTPQQISESLSINNGRLIVSGVIQRADAQNQNHRVYPSNILMREDKKYQDLIEQKRALGELDHPDSSVVNLSNVSHNILETWWKDKDLYGKIEILNTPAGQILKELLKCGVTLGISSRGVGSVQEIQMEDSGDVAYEIQEDFELICYDFVSNPSTHGAFMKPVNEGKEIRLNDNDKKINKINQIITDILCDISKIK